MLLSIRIEYLVLILVLVEDTRGDNRVELYSKVQKVLILVLVEDTRGGNKRLRP